MRYTVLLEVDCYEPYNSWGNLCDLPSDKKECGCVLSLPCGAFSARLVWAEGTLRILKTCVFREGYASGEFPYWREFLPPITATSPEAAVLSLAYSYKLRRKFGVEVSLDWARELFDGKAKYAGLYCY